MANITSGYAQQITTEEDPFIICTTPFKVVAGADIMEALYSASALIAEAEGVTIAAGDDELKADLISASIHLQRMAKAALNAAISVLERRAETVR